MENGQRLRAEALTQVIGCDEPARERWLFISPHDDDMCIGGGLWAQAALRADVGVSLLVVTDGAMGYCSADQRDQIVDIRKAETYESCDILGIDRADVHRIDYPDGGLFRYQGRRVAGAGEQDIHGYVGLQNAMTFYLRKIRPTRVIVPTHTDLHPDHKITHSELMISLFHASGRIWPELGPPLDDVPHVYEMAVYCDFARRPNLELMTDDACFGRKLDSIAAFRSQAQIAKLVEHVRDGGPYEYLCQVDFRFYSPDSYKD